MGWKWAPAIGMLILGAALLSIAIYLSDAALAVSASVILFGAAPIFLITGKPG